MDPLRRQFQSECAVVECQLLRDKHHGFSPAWRVEDYQRKLESLRKAFDSLPKQRSSRQLFPGLKLKTVDPAHDQLVRLNGDLAELRGYVSSLDANQQILARVDVLRSGGGVFAAKTCRRRIETSHASRRELFAGEDQDGQLLVFKQATSVAYSKWTDLDKGNAMSEARKWTQLDHPNILPFLGTAIFEDTFFLVSRFAERGDILRYLREEPDGPIFRLLYQVSYAIKYLHVQLRKVHGDIKPDNILVTGTRQALLCDFATIKINGIGSSANSASQRTLLYLSPECLNIESPTNTRTTASDIWAFGITIAQVLKRSGQPWEGPMSNFNKICQRVRDKDERPASPYPPFECPEEKEAWGVATRCWKREAAQRWHISEVSTQLQQCAVKSKQM